MILYAKILDKKTKEVQVGLETDSEYYKYLGMEEMDVEKADDGRWYLIGYAPEKPKPSLEEIVNELEYKYKMNRWQREAIIAEDSKYSEFVKERAKEIESLAEKLRGLK